MSLPVDAVLRELDQSGRLRSTDSSGARSASADRQENARRRRRAAVPVRLWPTSRHLERQTDWRDRDTAANETDQSLPAGFAKPAGGADRAPGARLRSQVLYRPSVFALSDRVPAAALANAKAAIDQRSLPGAAAALNFPRPRRSRMRPAHPLPACAQGGHPSCHARPVRHVSGDPISAPPRRSSNQTRTATDLLPLGELVCRRRASKWLSTWDWPAAESAFEAGDHALSGGDASVSAVVHRRFSRVSAALPEAVASCCGLR